MLAERDSKLLTAYLDGELSARQRKAVQRLLRRSPKARALLEKLQDDSHRLRHLRPVRPPADLPLRVLGAIAERGLAPTQGSPLAPAAASKPLPAWAGFALAASVLAAVTAGSFAFFRSELPPLEAYALPAGPGEFEPLPDLPPGTYFALADLAAEPARKELASTLAKDVAYHLDVHTAAPARQTVNRLASAFKERRVKVLVDAAAEQKLAKRQPKATYLVYAENLQPHEVSAVLQRLGGASRARAERVVLNPLTDSDRGQLSMLLGVRPEALRPAMKLHEPIFDPDGGKKGKPKQAPPTPLPGEPERYAVVLASDSAAPASDQLRHFLKSRRPARPGTLQVCFVIHEASA